MGFNTFTFSDVRTVLVENHKRISDKTIQVILSRMVKQRKIFTIKKGVFSLKLDDRLAGFAFAPFYYGGLAALMIRNLIDDQVKMEIMTTRNVKHSFVEIYGGNSMVVLHHMPKKYYFGFENLKYGDMIVPVSDPEKTLIDLFYYKQRLSLQDYSGVLKIARQDVLDSYLRHYNKRIKRTVKKFVKTYGRLAKTGRLENMY